MYHSRPKYTTLHEWSEVEWSGVEWSGVEWCMCVCVYVCVCVCVYVCVCVCVCVCVFSERWIIALAMCVFSCRLVLLAAGLYIINSRSAIIFYSSGALPFTCIRY